MTDIRQLEQSIIRPNLMLDFTHLSKKEDSRGITLAKDIFLAILIALVIMQ